MEEIKRRRGRPTIENPRNRQVNFMMNDDEYNRLDKLCGIFGISKADLFRYSVNSTLDVLEKIHKTKHKKNIVTMRLNDNEMEYLEVYTMKHGGKDCYANGLRFMLRAFMKGIPIDDIRRTRSYEKGQRNNARRS